MHTPPNAMDDPVIKVCRGRSRKIGWLTYVLEVGLLAYFILIRGRMP